MKEKVEHVNYANISDSDLFKIIELENEVVYDDDKISLHSRSIYKHASGFFTDEIIFKIEDYTSINYFKLLRIESPNNNITYTKPFEVFENYVSVPKIYYSHWVEDELEDD